MYFPTQMYMHRVNIDLCHSREREAGEAKLTEAVQDDYGCGAFIHIRLKEGAVFFQATKMKSDQLGYSTSHLCWWSHC